MIAAYKAKYITGGNSVFSNPAGPLGQLFGGFGGGGLIQVFASLVQNFLGVSGPFASIQQALNAIQKVPILSDLLAAITGSSTTGGGGIAGLTTFFTDFLGIFGHPTGLGTGSPTIPGVSSIPIFGPLITMFISLFGGTGSGVTGLTSVFTDFLGLLGHPTGLGTGSPGLPGVGSIPILGPLINQFITLFGGSGSGLSGLTSVFTDFLGLLGHPTGLGTGSPGLPAVGSIPILGPLIQQFITLLAGSGSGLTGLSGLTSVFGDLLGLFGSPTGLGTGSPTLPGVGSIPILGGLFSGGTIKAGLLQPLIDAVSQGFGGSTGLNFGGLQSFLTLIPGAQQLLDTIYHALTGDTSTGNPLSVITILFSAFPAANVVGVGGPATQAGTWQHLLDQLTGAFNLSSTTGAGFADLTAAGTSIASTLGGHTSFLNVRNNSPMHFAPDGTTEGPFPLADLTGTLTTIPITNSTAASSFTRIRADTIKTKIEWVSTGWTGTVTGFYLTANTQDPTTGTLTKLWTSPNLISGLTNAASHWESYDVPAAVQQLFPASQAVNVEAMITGTGTHQYNIAAKQVAIPAHPTALPSAWGAVRNNANTASAPSTISGGAIGYSANVPYLGWSSDTSSYHTPVTTQYNTAGTYTYTPPPWAKYIDRIVLGAGAGGSGGQSAFIPGFGGDPGSWVDGTIDLTATPAATLTVTVGTGGTGGAGGGTFSKPPGTNGTASSVSGSGVSTLTGAAGAVRTSGSTAGAGPGDITYLSQPYHGGTTQSSAGGAGGTPGGGGAGGGSVWYFGLAGGNGADGSVWLVARVS